MATGQSSNGNNTTPGGPSVQPGVRARGGGYASPNTNQMTQGGYGGNQQNGIPPVQQDNINLALGGILETGEALTTQVKVTKGYFTGDAGLLEGNNIYTGSLGTSNQDYYFNVTNTHPLSSSVATQFAVTYGDRRGSGSLCIDADGKQTLKSATEAIYQQFATLVLPEQEVSGGFHISNQGGAGQLSAGTADDFIYDLNPDYINCLDNNQNVVECTDDNGDVIDLQNPSSLPDPTFIKLIEEPWIKATIITPDEYLGSIIKLCQDKRGIQTNLSYSGNRAVLSYELPLNEVVFDFNDRIKSMTSGYASFDYEIIGHREGNLVKLGILVNGEPVDALAMMIHKDFAQRTGREVCEKLKDLIPRHNFMIPVQAAIGGKIIARETIKGFKKDVLTKIHGGGATDRKRKLLEKQKKGKARSKQFGRVEIPQEAFIGVLKINKEK